ncbi:hypothetical protein [Sansalvadorimonas verongulae]|uniref:hypothetical protein n=1 Tax=Sansalvadorimonas verongulae TaxID=2172824 RepID=UPI0012BBD1FB|nr:hypothetical protein [Sansalvadorimonas verongulae]MTI11857.1 hypothetical protein [Sansalvadorimonas verongulae]
MKNRIHSRKAVTLKLDLPRELSSKELTFLAYGNFKNIAKTVYVWCLFCDQDKQLHEVQIALSVLACFPLGSRFSNAFLVNSTDFSAIYKTRLDQNHNVYNEVPRRLLQADLASFEGQYDKQACIKIRNKHIQLTDIMLRTLCPAPEFGKIVLTLLGQSFIFRHVLRETDHIYVEVDGMYPFKITTAVARQLAFIAGSEEYRAWYRGISIHAGQMLASQSGLPPSWPTPNFKVNVQYTSINNAPKNTPFYQVIHAVPDLALPYKKITVYLKSQSETFLI